MKKIIRTVDEERDILQVTVSDERWYMKAGRDPVTDLPTYLPVPSVTWIAGHYPKGIGFYRWLADKGWDEAEAIKVAAGDKGSVVHAVIEMILRGEEVRVDTKVRDRARETEFEAYERDLTFEELLCVQSFINWRADLQKTYIMEVLATEVTVFSEIYGYAGTVDLIMRLTHKETGEVEKWVVDFKTSKQVWTEYLMQVSAYRVALENGENPIMERNANGTDTGKMVDLSGLKTAILQVGYERNKAGYKWTVVEDNFDLFLTAKKIWQNEVGLNTPGIQKREFPMVMSPKAKTPEELAKEAEIAPPAQEEVAAAGAKQESLIDPAPEATPEPSKIRPKKARKGEEY